MDREVKKEQIPFKDLRTVKSDKKYDENGKLILGDYKVTAAKVDNGAAAVKAYNGGDIYESRS